LNPVLTIGDRTFDKVCVIRHPFTGGLSFLITYALNETRRALENNYLPVIYYHREVAKLYYEAAYGENVWEYYFEPVMGMAYGQLQSHLRAGEIQSSQIVEEPNLTAHEYLAAISRDPDRIGTFWGYAGLKGPQQVAPWMAAKRRLGSDYVARYVRVKPHILRKVDLFHEDNFGTFKTYGVHIRGTDFNYAEPTPPERYIDTIRKLVNEADDHDFRIFLATDQAQFVDLFEREFENRVITHDCMRSSSEIPVHHMPSGSAYAKGEEVLIDMLLLSRCDHLLKCASAVGEYALRLNPAMPFTDFGLESGKHAGTALAPAYYKLNVARSHPLASYLKLQFKRAKRAVLHSAIWIGRYTLPVAVRDALWRRIGQRFFT
jgi:hypothetical protein